MFVVVVVVVVAATVCCFDVVTAASTLVVAAAVVNDNADDGGSSDDCRRLGDQNVAWSASLFVLFVCLLALYLNVFYSKAERFVYFELCVQSMLFFFFTTVLSQ